VKQTKVPGWKPLEELIVRRELMNFVFYNKNMILMKPFLNGRGIIKISSDR
jgi:hypothetical protein